MGWLGTWAKRKAIKYGTTKPSSSLTDFPLLIKIAGDTDIGAVLSSQKFAVTTSDGSTTTSYGAISFTSSGGSCTANLRAKFSPSSAASTGDVLGYLYYDNSQTDQENKSGVLDSYTKLYCPLEESPDNSAGQIRDWTGVNNGTSVNTPTSAAAEVANGISMNGSTQYIDCGNDTSLQITGDISLSCWAKFSASIPTDGYMLISKDNSSGGRAYTMDVSGFVGNLARIYINGGGASNEARGTTSLTTGTWYHIAGTYDHAASGGTLKMYVNGALEGTSTSAGTSIPSATTTARLGQRAYSGFNGYLNGVLDECRIAATNRSASWIAYEYANEANNSSTVTLGSEETNTPSGTAPRRIISGGEHLGLLLWEATGIC